MISTDHHVMFIGKTRFHLVVALAIALTMTDTAKSDSEAKTDVESNNKRLVQASFDRWRAGTGGPFELLADDAHWTIVGSSPVSKTYQSKKGFIAEVIRPFNARMEQPLKPTVRNIYADGDSVVVLFDGASVCIDGEPYRNTYAWFMQMKDGRVVNVTAFFDTRLFDEMWTRVAPK
jgi:uncharacterized protein